MKYLSLFVLSGFVFSCTSFKKIDSNYYVENIPVFSITYQNHNIANSNYVFIGIYENGFMRLRKGKKVKYIYNPTLLKQVTDLIEKMPNERLQSEYPLTIRSSEAQSGRPSGRTFGLYIHPTAIQRVQFVKNGKLHKTDIYEMDDNNLPNEIKEICKLFYVQRNTF